VTRVREALNLIIREYEKASLNPDYNSPHEGLGFLLEEVNELQDEVFKKAPDYAAIELEAAHVAAVAMRIIAGVCLKARGQ
jgi:NTP pyrophosphatase (non-canonical NTP hydrolase)